jgi:IclR family pca regulon transcriptional regulator
MECDAPEIDRKDLIDGLGKGLRVIECFDFEHPRLTTTEVSTRTGLSRAAARRHLLTLCHFGYADTDGRYFWLAPRVLRLGRSFLDSARLPRLVQPFIQRISMQCGETVNYSVLDGHEIVYVARSNPPKLVSIGYHVGARVPAHLVAPGAAILSTLNDAELDGWLAAHEFVAFVADATCDRTQFLAEVQAARSLHYQISHQQLDVGLAGIAVPLRDRKGTCTGAIGMTVQQPAYSESQMIEKLLPLLRSAAQDLRTIL